MSEYYFAYGSNLCIEQMIERTGQMRTGVDRPRIARLPGYRLLFNMQDEGGLVFANVQSPGDRVFGVIYSCTPDDFKRLDEYEQGYERLGVWVVAENGEWLKAVTYTAKPARVSFGGKPSSVYLCRIVRGARQHGLPEAYVHEIEMLASGHEI